MPESQSLNRSPLEKETYWRRVVKEYELSGVSRKSYSESHNLVLSQLTYWARKFGKESKRKSGFVELNKSIPAEEIRESSTRELEIEFVDGIIVRLRG